MSLILTQSISVILTIGAALWLWHEPGYEPFLAVIGGIGALVGTDIWHLRRRSSKDTRLSMEKSADDYDRIRKQEKSTFDRSARMTACTKQMIIDSDSIHDFPFSEWLVDSRDGRRLGAYVYAFTKPDPKFFTNLVTQVCLHERPPFNIYWGLLAIRQCLGEHRFDPSRSKIKEQLSRLAVRIKERSEIRGAGPDISFLMTQIDRMTE